MTALRVYRTEATSPLARMRSPRPVNAALGFATTAQCQKWSR